MAICEHVGIIHPDQLDITWPQFMDWCQYLSNEDSKDYGDIWETILEEYNDDGKQERTGNAERSSADGHSPVHEAVGSPEEPGENHI